MPAFEGADLDVVKPEPSHKGYATKFTSTASTNEPSEIQKLSVQFADNIPRCPPHDPKLTIADIVNMEESGLRRSIRSQNPTQREK